MASRNGRHEVLPQLGNEESTVSGGSVNGPATDDHGEILSAPLGTAAAHLARGNDANHSTSVDLGEPDAETLARRMLAPEMNNWGHPDEPLWQTHPKLAEFLFKKTWNKITPREVGLITISVRPTGLSVSLKLPSEASQVTVPISLSTQIWDALLHAVLNRSGDWKELKNGPGAAKLREDRKKLGEIEKSRK